LNKSLDAAMKVRENKIQYEQHHNHITHLARISSERAMSLPVVGEDINDELYELEGMSVLSDISMPATHGDVDGRALGFADMGDDGEYPDGVGVQVSLDSPINRRLLKIEGADIADLDNDNELKDLSISETPKTSQRGHSISSNDLHSVASQGSIGMTQASGESSITPHVSYYSLKKGAVHPLALARSFNQSQGQMSTRGGSSSVSAVQQALEESSVSSSMSRPSTGAARPTSKELRVGGPRSISVSDFPIAAPGRSVASPIPNGFQLASNASVRGMNPEKSTTGLQDGSETGGHVQGWGGHIRAGSSRGAKKPLDSILSVTSYNNSASSCTGKISEDEIESKSKANNGRLSRPVSRPVSTTAELVQTSGVISLPSIHTEHGDLFNTSILARPPSPLQPSAEAALCAELDRERERQMRNGVVDFDLTPFQSRRGYPPRSMSGVDVGVGDDSSLETGSIASQQGSRASGIGESSSVRSIPFSPVNSSSLHRPGSKQGFRSSIADAGTVKNSSGGAISMPAISNSRATTPSNSGSRASKQGHNPAMTLGPSTSGGSMRPTNSATIMNLRKEFLGR
jgi:hypothetical protein